MCLRATILTLVIWRVCFILVVCSSPSHQLETMEHFMKDSGYRDPQPLQYTVFGNNHTKINQIYYDVQKITRNNQKYLVGSKREKKKDDKTLGDYSYYLNSNNRLYNKRKKNLKRRNAGFSNDNISERSSTRYWSRRRNGMSKRRSQRSSSSQENYHLPESASYAWTGAQRHQTNGHYLDSSGRKLDHVLLSDGIEGDAYSGGYKEEALEEKHGDAHDYVAQSASVSSDQRQDTSLVNGRVMFLDGEVERSYDDQSRGTEATAGSKFSRNSAMVLDQKEDKKDDEEVTQPKKVGMRLQSDALFLGHQMHFFPNRNEQLQSSPASEERRSGQYIEEEEVKGGKAAGDIFKTVLQKTTEPKAMAFKPQPVPRLKDVRAFRPESLMAAKALLRESPLIDGHNDLPWNLQVLLHNRLQHFNLSSDLRIVPPFRGSAFSHTDMPRMRHGMIGAQMWSVHIPCGAQYRNAVQLMVEQIDVVRRMLQTSQQTTLVTTPGGLEAAWRAGMVASMISVGGGHGLGSSVGVLRSMYELGVTSVALTHACHTPWAESAQGAEGKASQRGLTGFGKDMVREMNRLGIIIDLAHASTATARDAIAASRAPTIISHTAARAICNLPRNVPDTILRELGSRGGLAMLTFDSDFLACGRNATLYTVIEHLEHLRRVAGIDHIGLGAAFDGFDKPAHGLQDTSQYPNLFAALLETKPSWSKEDLLKLAGRNFIRVFHRVKQVQDDLASEPASEAIIPYKDIDKKWPCRYKFTKPHHPYA